MVGLELSGNRRIRRPLFYRYSVIPSTEVIRITSLGKLSVVEALEDLAKTKEYLTSPVVIDKANKMPQIINFK